MRKLVALALFTAGAAIAEDHRQEFRPELNAFYKLTDVHRLFISSYLEHNTNSDRTTGELGANLDVTLKPLLRQHQSADWERDRLLWMRVGYERLGPVDGGEGIDERRFLLEGTGRAQLPAHAWLAVRLRAEQRDLNGVSAQRYRVRLSLDREFVLAGVTTVPYLRAEVGYDSRFNAWNRHLYQAGAEVALSRHWRIEPYLARQDDTRSATSNLHRLGLIFKYYQ